MRINKEAMESDYVSRNLHHWIDLIWGYKQTGKEAIKANNVFYYMTYINGIDRDKIQDNALKEALELQIAHFGQIPMQLFWYAHPSKKVPINNNLSTSNSKPRPFNKSVVPTSIRVASLGSSPNNSPIRNISLSNVVPSNTSNTNSKSSLSDEEIMTKQSPCTYVSRTSSKIIYIYNISSLNFFF